MKELINKILDLIIISKEEKDEEDFEKYFHIIFVNNYEVHVQIKDSTTPFGLAMTLLGKFGLAASRKVIIVSDRLDDVEIDFSCDLYK